ncbi:MAG: hypothetical protein IKV00_03240 [Clostridia bacterium]|nr:hypothetical protein [Clostridia bacterium]
MNENDKLGICLLSQIVLLIVATFLLFSNFYTARQAGVARDMRRAAKKIEFVVTDKENEFASSNYVRYDLICSITNDSRKTFNKISGTLKIMDQKGNVLSSGEAWFSGTFEPGSKKEFRLSWESSITDKALQAYEADFSELKFSYIIEEVTYDGYRVVEIR